MTTNTTTPESALRELEGIFVNVRTNRVAVKRILTKLAQDAYRRGFAIASKAREGGTDHE